MKCKNITVPWFASRFRPLHCKKRIMMLNFILLVFFPFRGQLVYHWMMYNRLTLKLKEK